MHELIVTVNKADLREKVQRNRDNHRLIFEEALEGYRLQAIEALDERIKDFRKGRIPDLMEIIRLPVPQDHTSDYDRVLEMLDMHQGDTIDISQEDFANYVRDDWSWKKQFLSTASNYTSRAN